MKSIFIFFLTLLSFQSKATRYYVSSSQGNNSNNGTSTATPWQTLSKVNAVMSLLVPGDTVSFRKGDTFAGTMTISRSGTALANLVFNSYGTGNKPLFTGTGSTISALIYAIPGRSYLLIDGIAITDPTFPPDPNRDSLARIQVGINLDQATYCTIQNCDMSLVGTGVYTAQGGYHNINNNTIYNLRMIVNDNVRPDNDYGANQLTLNSSNNSVTHNTFYGGWAKSYDFTFDGGAIEFYDEGSGCSNNYIAYNLMYDNNGISETGGSPRICNNNVFVYNKMINNRDVFYLHGSHTGWQFYNNAVVETFNNRLPPTSTMSGDAGTTTQIDVKNNVFQIGIGGTVINTGRINATHTNNVYKLSGGTTLGFSLTPTEVSTSAAFWSNTTNSDPVLWNYAPLNPGLLIATGVNVGQSFDYNGNPVTNPPDISILQSVSPPPPPPTPINKLITKSRFVQGNAPPPPPPSNVVLSFTTIQISDIFIGDMSINCPTVTTLTVDWGDGNVETLPSGTTIYLSHTYANVDNYNIIATFDNTYGADRIDANYFIKSIDLTKCVNLTQLFLGGTDSLSSVDLSQCVNLTTLNLDFNSLLTSLDISHNTNLNYANLSYNALSSLDVSNNINLEQLFVQYNNLSTINLNNNINLKQLNTNGNPITSLDLSHNTLLQGLQLVGNLLTSLNIANNTILAGLYCQGNPLTSIDISNNVLLNQFGCSGCQLSNLDITNNPLLTILQLQGNNLSVSSVNTILNKLVSFGLFSGQLILYQQTPPAPPSGQGVTDKGTLLSRSWFVNTD